MIVTLTTPVPIKCFDLGERGNMITQCYGQYDQLHYT